MSGKLRKFQIRFSDDHLEKVNDLMRRFDLFSPGTGAFYTGTISTTSTLSLEEYRKTIEPAFDEMKGVLYDIKEVTDGEE